jgi:ABC-type Fe3+ transport system permease subunit
MSGDVTSEEETSVTNENGSTTGGNPADGPVKKTSRLGRWWWVAGVAIAALVVVVFAPLASSDPDGLERVAEDQGFIDRASNFFSGLLGDYAIPGISDPAVSTIVSGLIGVAIVLVVMFALGRLLARRRA